MIVFAAPDEPMDVILTSERSPDQPREAEQMPDGRSNPAKPNVPEQASLAPQALIRTICRRGLKTRCLTFGLPSRKRSSAFRFVDDAFDAVVSQFGNNLRVPINVRHLTPASG